MGTQDAIFRKGPATLQSVLHDLDRAERRARALLEGISDVQAAWQPHEGSWSISECLDHLARTNAAYLGAFREAIKHAGSAARTDRDSIKPGLFCGIFMRMIEPPPKAKVCAPKIVTPSPRANKDEVLRSFLKSHEEIRAFVRDGQAFDMNRLRFQNPFVSCLRFRVGAGLLIIAAHERRHLWQAEQVRGSPAFPSAL